MKKFSVAAAPLLFLALAATPAQAASATSALVSVASPQVLHPQNAQNEPALAVDASRPTVLAAGANELVDMQPCSQLASTTAGATGPSGLIASRSSGRCATAGSSRWSPSSRSCMIAVPVNVFVIDAIR